MTEILSRAGYEQTRAKLADLEKRLSRLNQRSDLSPVHLAEARRSYQTMIRQYRRELKLYEANQPGPAAGSAQ
jgi:hypothetical protein